MPPSLANGLLLPVDADVRIGAVFEKLLRQLDGADAAGGQRRPVRGIADAGGAVGAGLAEERQGMKRRSARIGSVRVRAAIEQHGGQLEIGIDDGHVQRARPVGRGLVDVGAAVEQDLDRIEVAVPDGEKQWS